MASDGSPSPSESPRDETRHFGAQMGEFSALTNSSRTIDSCCDDGRTARHERLRTEDRAPRRGALMYEPESRRR